MESVLYNVSTPFAGALFSFVLCASLCWLVITNPDRVPGLGHMQQDAMAKQAMHRRPTPRIGGAAVIVAFAISLSFLLHDIARDLLLVLMAGGIVFAAGLKEDLLRNVSPRSRLIAAFASAALAVFLSSQMINRLNMGDIDWVIGLTAVSVLVTLLWSAGACHSLNLIDGLHGLSASYTLTALVALNLIAGQTGDYDVQLVSVVLMGALAGFLVFNWPGGRIFMGDAGAYALGHVLAWLGIILVARNPAVSPLAILLILFWPVADTLFSIIRRKLFGRAVDQPDRMHFHHIVVRAISRFRKKGFHPLSLNATATLFIIPLFAAPALTGVIFWNQPVKALITLGFFTAAFIATYWVIVSILSSKRRGDRQARQNWLEQQSRSEIERSTLSGVFVQDSLAVDVRITKHINTPGWALHAEAADARGRSWAQTYATDHEAWTAFLETVRKDGIEAIVGAPLEDATTRTAFSEAS